MDHRSSTTGSAVAERLYYDSPVLDFPATVTDIRLVGTETAASGTRAHLWQVSLDRTAFYPESGGQPWDTGVLVATARSGTTLEVPVERVEEDAAGEIWHTVRKPLEQGTAVTGRVDAARRMDHMQQHSGQHLLSAVFLRLMGARTVSFHLGTESVTIDLAFSDGSTSIGAEQVASVEDEVNRIIFENRPMTPRWHTRDQAEAMLARGELRKLPDRAGALRVVEMEGVEFNACGGTHVAATGAIGGLMLRGTEKVKQGVRVEFVCGLRAVRVAREQHRLLSGVAGSLSVGAADLPVRLAALQEESRAALKERRALLDELARAEAETLLRVTPTNRPVQTIFISKPIEFLKRVASVCAAAGYCAIVGSTERAVGSVVLALPAGAALNAGQVLREVLSGLGARGGGSAELAQGTCPADQMAQLLNALASRVG